MKNKLFNLFKKKHKPVFSIREGVNGYYFYHIAKNNIPLCGDKRTMGTGLKLDFWGKVSPHIGEKYCKKCEENWNRVEAGL